METRKLETPGTLEQIDLQVEESKTLPSTEEMLSVLQEDPTRCLSWL
ncbi:Hypothetical protein DEACI_1650 [Acididesulfobacillus acetoxydans]|uniref:Uncharacterized protein n=1 Tax=Acididesulfobacillus acetoxydans TaxID=1561005 RepID=A0A8S0XWF3_9FIRM|nr:hypothetical protein [Acididesulfobacillus acetoxydans]CAA7600997.1 Hypothetical protein DEACI_1650 [Acididesulfobacillus acetoxydans]CEJ07720.1 Hypothetical protein DEACI_2186 [Acididesulfobacillus acetoxydans]